jgi:hypothetical protein
MMGKEYEQLRALELTMRVKGKATVVRSKLVQSVLLTHAIADREAFYDAIPSGWAIVESGWWPAEQGVRFVRLEREVTK